jgi:adenine/guanine phosphoribosyltransferase-like PRPP-binding protein
MTHPEMTTGAPAGQSWTVTIAGGEVTLPIIPIKSNFAISLLMVIDAGVSFGERCGRALAEKLTHFKPQVIVGPATLGIPVAIELSRALGLDQYVILQKSPKIHLIDALEQNITAITSKGQQRLLLDRRALPLLQGKRVVLVDDVVASGGSLSGALSLLRQAEADVVAIGTILTEAHDWRERLGADAALVQSLAHIPQFTRTADDALWTPIPESL